jgi:hypothetical protein
VAGPELSLAKGECEKLVQVVWLTWQMQDRRRPLDGRDPLTLQNLVLKKPKSRRRVATPEIGHFPAPKSLPKMCSAGIVALPVGRKRGNLVSQVMHDEVASAWRDVSESLPWAREV